MKAATRAYTVTKIATGEDEIVEAANVGQVDRFLAQRDYTVRPTKAAELLRAVKANKTISTAKDAVPESLPLPLPLPPADGGDPYLEGIAAATEASP